MFSDLTRIVPLAFASGLNIYATVAVLGLAQHYHLIELPQQFQAFDHPVVIGAAIVLYAIAFFADKIPWFDTVWDAIHTFSRLGGGAFASAVAMGDASPTATALATLVGGMVAMTTHATKTGTRAAANTSPEPFSNWALSVGEDALAVTVSYLALKHP